MLITSVQENHQESVDGFELILAEGVTTEASWSRDELYSDDAR